jgi:predicted DNA-binding transcriptional regulator AlpA
MPDGLAHSVGAPGRHHLDRRASDLAQVGAAAGDADELLNTSAVARWLGLSTPFLEIGRSRGYGPRFVRLSTRRIRYRRSDVLAWLAERTHAATAEYPGRRGAGPGRPRRAPPPPQPAAPPSVMRTARFVRRAPLPTE